MSIESNCLPSQERVPFADEIFRVSAQSHREISVIPANGEESPFIMTTESFRSAQILRRKSAGEKQVLFEESD